MGTYHSHMTRSIAQLVASRINGEMATQGVSVKQLADATGIARMTLTRRLTGNSPLTISELDTICAYFGTTADRLMTEVQDGAA